MNTKWSVIPLRAETVARSHRLSLEGRGTPTPLPMWTHGYTSRVGTSVYHPISGNANQLLTGEYTRLHLVFEADVLLQTPTLVVLIRGPFWPSRLGFSSHSGTLSPPRRPFSPSGWTLPLGPVSYRAHGKQKSRRQATTGALHPVRNAKPGPRRRKTSNPRYS